MNLLQFTLKFTIVLTPILSFSQVDKSVNDSIPKIKKNCLETIFFEEIEILFSADQLLDLQLIEERRKLKAEKDLITKKKSNGKLFE